MPPTAQLVKDTAISMAYEIGVHNIDRSALCERAGIKVGSFGHIMGQPFTKFIDELAKEVPDTGHKVTKKRVNGEGRERDILMSALELAKTVGYKNLSWQAVGDAAGVSHALVCHYFGTKPKLQRDIMRAAVRFKVLEVILQGLVAKDPHALKAPDDLKLAAQALIG